MANLKEVQGMRIFKQPNSSEGMTGTLVQYETMREFDEILKDEHHIDGRDKSSNSSDYSFTGTRNFEEAENLRKFGDKKSLDLLTETKAVTDKAFLSTVGTKVSRYNDVQGFQPIVPNAIIGLPLSMVNQKRSPKKVRTVDVFINSSQVWSTDKEDIALRGAYTLSAIDALERSGYRCNLYIGKVSWTDKSSSHVSGFFMNIKKPENPLNLMKVAYYIVNPSFLRRTGFRILENESNLHDYTGGYGQNTEFEHQRQFILDNIKSDQLVVVDSTCRIERGNSDEKNLGLIKQAFKGILGE